MCPFPNVPCPDILRSVVIRVHFVPALLATELFSVTVVVVREPAVRPRTAGRRVVWLDLFHRDTPFRCLVGDILE